MQFKLLFICGIFFQVMFASCSKETNDINALTAIEGNWAGKYSILSEPYNNFYSFKFLSDGTLERLDETGQSTGEGTWEFTNDNTLITGTYTLLLPAEGTFSFVANFDKVLEELDGTWGNDLQEYGGGYWYMFKLD